MFILLLYFFFSLKSTDHQQLDVKEQLDMFDQFLESDHDDHHPLDHHLLFTLDHHVPIDLHNHPDHPDHLDLRDHGYKKILINDNIIKSDIIKSGKNQFNQLKKQKRIIIQCN